MIITPYNRFGFNQEPPDAEDIPYVQTFNGRVGDVVLLQEDLDGLITGGGGGGPIAISDVTGLQAELDSKADLVHTHVIADVTGLQAALDATEPTIAAGTTSQYWRGDKSWQTLDKTAVGLANVDNTSDANKPVSTATQTALNLKATAGAVGSSGLTMSTARVLGRTTASTGVVEELTAAGLKTFLSLTSSDVSGLGYFATGTDAANLTGTVAAARMPALTGDVTTSTGSVATTIANGAVSLAKMANMATGSLIYRKTAGSGAPEVQTLATLKTDLGLTGTNTGDQTITLTGDVTGSGTGSFATTIGSNKVTYAQMQDVSATNRFIGRITAGAGDPEEVTGTQATTLLDTFTSGLKGLAPASGGGTTNFLRADGTWTAPPAGGGSGSITASGYTMTTARMLGRTTASTGAIEEMTAANVKTFLALTASDVGALGVTAGSGVWAGYVQTTNLGSGLRAYESVNGRSVTLDLIAGPGAVYGENNGATQWFTVGGALTANTRLSLTGSHSWEFSAQPYVGTNAIFHEGNYPNPRIQAVTSSATVTPTFSNDMVKITAQAAALNLANPTGTAVAGKKLVIRIKDNGTARAITYGTQYRAIGVTLPTTTVISKTLYLALIYNSDDTKWDVVGVNQEA